MALINLVTANNRTVDPLDDALMHHFTKGPTNLYAGGVLEGYGSEFELTRNGSKITVNKGAGLLWGRLFRVEQGNEPVFDLAAQGSSTIYGLVYVQIDLSNTTSPTANIQVSLNVGGTYYPDVADGDNLLENPNGLARMPLVRFIYQSSSGITHQELRTGLYTSNMIHRAEMADSIVGTGKINGRRVDNIIDPNSDRVIDSQRIAGNKINDYFELQHSKLSLATRLAGVRKTTFSQSNYTPQRTSATHSTTMTMTTVGNVKVYSNQSADDINGLLVCVELRPSNSSYNVCRTTLALERSFNDQFVSTITIKGMVGTTWDILGHAYSMTDKESETAITAIYEPLSGDLKIGMVIISGGSAATPSGTLRCEVKLDVRLRGHSE